MGTEAKLEVGKVYIIDHGNTKGRFVKEEKGSYYFKCSKRMTSYGRVSNGLVPFTIGDFEYKLSDSQRL